MRLSAGQRTFMERFVKPAVPIVVVLLLLRVFGYSPHLITLVSVALVCAIVLWLGWTWVRRNIVARWIGILLVAYLGLVFALFALGMTLTIGPLLLLLFFVALPFLLYDLLFRQPRKGRFARARAARRNLPM